MFDAATVSIIQQFVNESDFSEERKKRIIGRAEEAANSKEIIWGLENLIYVMGSPDRTEDLLEKVYNNQDYLGQLEQALHYQ